MRANSVFLIGTRAGKEILQWGTCSSDNFFLKENCFTLGGIPLSSNCVDRKWCGGEKKKTDVIFTLLYSIQNGKKCWSVLKSLERFCLWENSRWVSRLMVKQQFSSPASVVGIDELSWWSPVPPGLAGHEQQTPNRTRTEPQTWAGGTAPGEHHATPRRTERKKMLVR